MVSSPHLWMAQEYDRRWLESMPADKRDTILRERMFKRLTQKDERMQRRLARHRAAIWKRRLAITGGAFLAMTALPLAVFVVSELWKLATRSLIE